MGLMIFIIDPSFSTISLDIRKLVDGECMLLVQRRAMEGFGCSDSLFGCLIFNKSVSVGDECCS